MARRKPEDDILGNRGLARFDFCIIGSGAGGGTADRGGGTVAGSSRNAKSSH